MIDKPIKEMSIAELKKASTYYWEESRKAHKKAMEGGNGEEIQRRRAAACLEKMNEVDEELRNREQV